MGPMQHPLRVADEVRAALAEARPVVALESTIITHGMPPPVNLETARAVEAAVRSEGAVPATVAVVDGVLAVGLSAAELRALAESAAGAVKVSRADLPVVLARGGTGGTTVAATMIVARMAGIDLFATGGLGGVHRGAPSSFDISADLQELARTDVTVVCAGVKSILDLGLTLEYLETHGVPVVGFGTEVLPAFYVRESPHPLSYRVDTAAAVAEIIRVRRRLALGGGMVVANPIPAEHAMAPVVVDAAIDRAVDEAGRAGIAGKEVTPFLLRRVGELTGRSSLDANTALVVHNARVAAAIASELCRVS